MRKIGLIGGMSWISTEQYYRIINQQVTRKVGGVASAPLLIESLDFSEIARSVTDEDWSRVSSVLIGAARRLADAGAEGLAICANSVHRIYDDIAGAVNVPVLHIADCVGQRMTADGVKSAALLGTRNVMSERWYRQRLVKHGVTLTPPDLARADAIDKIVYEELIFGKPNRIAERTMKSFIAEIDQQGADAVILGSTELSMVVDVRANILPIYDSGQVHAEAIADWILAE